MATSSLEVEIVSRETIKPSSPTPESLRIYKLSLLDQIHVGLYAPIVLFYSPATATEEETIIRSDRLKKSLSKILTHIYPLAGRVKDMFSIECNDGGVDFIQARITENMSAVLQHLNLDLLRQLLPTTLADEQVRRLAVQVNDFTCGGTAIGLHLAHEIADGSSMATFLKNWAAIARGDDNVEGGGFILDCTSLFPPQDVTGFSICVPDPPYPIIINQEQEEIAIIQKKKKTSAVTKRFVFDSSKIAALREKAVCESERPPTRVEAVLAFIWAAVIAASRERGINQGGGGIKKYLLMIPINLRSRMDPPLPPHSFGNIVQTIAEEWPATDDDEKATLDYNYKVWVKRVRELFKRVNDDHIRKLHADGVYFKRLKHTMEKIRTANGEILSFFFTSTCKMPINEADFGWGKPIRVVFPFKLDNSATFMDSGSDGDGIEACVGLSEEDMDALDQNLEFLAYVSSSHTF